MQGYRNSQFPRIQSSGLYPGSRGEKVVRLTRGAGLAFPDPQAHITSASVSRAVGLVRCLIECIDAGFSVSAQHGGISVFERACLVYCLEMKPLIRIVASYYHLPLGDWWTTAWP